MDENSKTVKRKPKFLRRDSNRYSKLGKNRKKKQVWRRPTGRDNKMREKRTGYPSIVSIGYRTDKADRGKLEEKNTITVRNIRDLDLVGKDHIAVLGGFGKKKKLEIAKKAKEAGIKIHNLNVDRFLKKNDKPAKEKSKEAGK